MLFSAPACRVLLAFAVASKGPHETSGVWEFLWGISLLLWGQYSGLGSGKTSPAFGKGRVFLREGGNVVTEDYGLKPYKTNT